MLVLRHSQNQLARRCTLRSLSTTAPRLEPSTDAEPSTQAEPSEAPKSSLSARLAASSFAGVPIYNAPKFVFQSARSRPSNNSTYSNKSSNQNPGSRRYNLVDKSPQRTPTPATFGWTDGVVQSSLSDRLWRRQQQMPHTPEPSPPSSSSFLDSVTKGASPSATQGQSSSAKPSADIARPKRRATADEAKTSRQQSRREAREAERLAREESIAKNMTIASTDLGSLFGVQRGSSTNAAAATTTTTAVEGEQTEVAAKATKPKKKPSTVATTIPSLRRIQVRQTLERFAGDYSRYSPIRKATRHTVGPVRYARYALKKDLSPPDRKVVLGVIEGLVKPRKVQAVQAKQ